MKQKRNILSKTYSSDVATYYKIIKYHGTSERPKEYELWRTKNKKENKIISIRGNIIYNIE